MSLLWSYVVFTVSTQFVVEELCIATCTEMLPTLPKINISSSFVEDFHEKEVGQASSSD